MPIDGFRGDRRIQRRYPVVLELEYKVMENGDVVSTGVGTTENISSGGVLFLTQSKLAGPAVELSIHWPAVSDGESFMELRMSGRILRSDANGTAMQMCRYHFQKVGSVVAPVERLLENAVIQ